MVCPPNLSQLFQVFHRGLYWDHFYSYCTLMTSPIQLPCESNMVLYADDMLLYRQISADNDYQHLQHCVNLLSSWCSRNHLTFNSNKCKCMVFSRRHSRAIKFPSLCLGSTPLELVHSYKYLGVTLTSDLSWSEHIQSISVKSKKFIRMLYRRFYGNADPATILILYCTLVHYRAVGIKLS